MENQMTNGQLITQSATPDLLAESLLEEFPEVEMAAGVTPSEWFGEFTIANGEGKKVKALGQFAGQQFFEMFSFPLVAGEASTVMEHKNAIVLTEKLAENIFGDTEGALGENLQWEYMNMSFQVVVTGVFEDLHRKSTENFDFMLTYASWLGIRKTMGVGKVQLFGQFLAESILLSFCSLFWPCYFTN